MPMIERRPRTRLRNRPESDITGPDELRAVIEASHGDDDAWREARPRVVRYLAQRLKDAAAALRIAEVYHRRPDLLPMRAPACCRGSNTG